MRTPAPDLQRWSEELARNPASLSFLPLARAYRRQGRRDLALKVCTRGLEHHPNHVEAHALLALLHLESGDRERAADEWSIVLRLKPGNFEALRGMGFRYLERNDLVRARQHLERAALIRPGDPVVREALRLLDQRHEGTGIAAAPPPPALESATAQPAAEASTSTPDRPHVGQRRAAVAERASAPDWLTPQPPAADFPFAVVTMPTAEPVSEAAMSEVEDAPLLELDMVVEEPPAELELPETEPTNTLSDEEPWAVASMVGLPDEASEPDAAGPIIRATDPNRLFDALLDSTPLVGALLLDKRGLVLAGALGRDIGGRADDLGAIIGGAIDDAARTVAHLAIGDWRVMLLESETAVVHVSPIDGRGILVLAARRDAPTGWLMRTAAHAVEMATRFLEAEQ